MRISSILLASLASMVMWACSAGSDAAPTVELPAPASLGCYVSDRMSSQQARGTVCNVRWETHDLPLRVRAPFVLHADIGFAVDYINSYVGVEIFTTDPVRGGYTLDVIEDDFGGGAYLGNAMWNWSEFHMSFARIALWTGFGVGPSHDRRYVAVHELLHTLGFSHDEVGCSILMPGFNPGCLNIEPHVVRAMGLIYGHSSAWIIARPHAETATSSTGLSSTLGSGDHVTCGVGQH